MVIIDFNIYGGDSFSKTFTINEDFTNKIFSFNLVDSVGTQLSGTITWLDQSIGKFTLSLTGTQTSSLASGLGKYDVYNSSDEETIFKGRIIVEEDV
jgi:hypothetical protein